MPEETISTGILSCKRLDLIRPLWQGVPRRFARTVSDTMVLACQAAKMFLERVAARTGDAHHVADGDAAMLTCLVNNLNPQHLLLLRD